MPETLCGGTFRTRRGRKRKRKRGSGVKSEGLTYAERQQRRIEKKFGKNGQALGGGEEARIKLENGKKPKGKPRVAGSARGRELRAAAALARFGTQKEEEFKKEELPRPGGSESDSDSDSDMENVKPEKEAFDLNGSKLLDSKGRGMVKVCEDEDENDVYVKEEMDELHNLATIESHKEEIPPRRRGRPSTSRQVGHGNKHPHTNNREAAAPVSIKRELSSQARIPPPEEPETSTPQTNINAMESRGSHVELTCSVCSMVNEPSAPICVVCSHVMQPRLMPGNWRCRSSACEGSKYVNAGDCGICGACGSKKPDP
ncbi:MAG: hypothetical protein Q9170_006051 [Blastenia crenularia]